MSSRGSALLLLAAALASCDAPEPPTAPSSQVAEARRLLTQAGFPDGRGFPKLTVLYNTSEAHESIAAAIQEMWRKELGIHVELRNVEWAVFLATVERGEFDIARRGWFGEYDDPYAFLELFAADSGSNPTGWASPRYEELLRRANDEPDAARRLGLLAQAERVLLDEAPAVPIYHYRIHNLMRPFIKGVHPNSRDIHPLQGVTLEGEGRPKDGVLVFNAGSEPQSLDPAISHDIGGYKILMHLFEGLVMPDARTGRPVPALAERWEISADGTRYTFHLRAAQWSNGDPVTARDFVYAWRRAVDPKTASTYARHFHPIAGAREITGGADPSTLGVRAVGERVLEVSLVRPTPYFLQLLCLNVYFPVHRATIQRHGRDWTRVENLVGNGPYRMTEWTLKQRKVFEKNPRYREADRVTLEKFVFLAVEDSETAFRLYEAGECHWLFTIPLPYMSKVAGRPDHWSCPANGAYFYVFNTRRKPLDDPRVRRALSLAVDREDIVRHILQGGERAAHRLTPPLYPGYEVR